MRRKDIMSVGVFDQLRIIRYIHPNQYECKCTCTKVRTVSQEYLNRPGRKSCRECARKRQGVHPSKKDLEKREKVKKLRSEGLTYGQIGAILSLSRQRIHQLAEETQ